MAQSQLRLKRAQVHVKEEASQDSYDNPDGDGSNIFLAENIEITMDSTNYERNVARGDGLVMDETPGTVATTIAFDILLKGGGAAGTAPEFSEALKMCGMELNTVATTSDTYTPLLTFDGTGGNPGPSYSVTVLEDGVAYGIGGAFANAVFTLAVGEPGRCRITAQGAHQAVVDDGIESPTYDTTVPPAFMGATFAINYGGAVTPKGVSNMTLDLGNNVVMGSDVNKTYGFYGSRIVSRKSTGTIDPEMELVATVDYFGIWVAGTSGTVTTGTIGGTAGNQWALTINRSVLRPPTLQDRNGIRALEVPFAVSSAATDAEGTNFDIQLVFT